MSASAIIESVDASVLTKVAVFLLVQALVYIILSNSSDLFSRNKLSRSFSFKPSRSASIQRILAVISDVPTSSEPSPSSYSSPARSSKTAFQEYPSTDDLDVY